MFIKKTITAFMMILFLVTGYGHEPFEGRWWWDYKHGMEEVEIKVVGNVIIATKITGDPYVPAGNCTWWGSLITNDVSWHIAQEPGADGVDAYRPRRPFLEHPQVRPVFCRTGGRWRRAHGNRWLFPQPGGAAGAARVYDE